ncbi:MAG: hypothetical protein OER04_09740 [Cyclobacteriaceae bacterium]|nr:hypothetical protein [Cyclobacteriaceae bacterium]
MSTKSNRRRFLSKTVKAVIPMGIGSMPIPVHNSEKVKLLTSEGKLVEIDQEVMDSIAQKATKRTTNEEILSWTNQVKTKPDPHE